jgi:hypothetical protein
VLIRFCVGHRYKNARDYRERPFGGWCAPGGSPSQSIPRRQRRAGSHPTSRNGSRKGALTRHVTPFNLHHRWEYRPGPLPGFTNAPAAAECSRKLHRHFKRRSIFSYYARARAIWSGRSRAGRAGRTGSAWIPTKAVTDRPARLAAARTIAATPVGKGRVHSCDWEAATIARERLCGCGFASAVPKSEP